MLFITTSLCQNSESRIPRLFDTLHWTHSYRFHQKGKVLWYRENTWWGFWSLQSIYKLVPNHTRIKGFVQLVKHIMNINNNHLIFQIMYGRINWDWWESILTHQLLTEFRRIGQPNLLTCCQQLVVPWDFLQASPLLVELK